MNAEIERLKKELSDAIDGNADWKGPYRQLMKTLYSQPVLYFALSKQQFDLDSGTSIPLISTKDFGGAPALYVFSDMEIAKVWDDHYGHVSADGRFMLIGAMEKEPFGFNSVFQLAVGMQVEGIMLDEGGSYAGLELNAFLSANELDPDTVEIPLSPEDQEALLSGNENGISFVPVKATPMEG